MQSSSTQKWATWSKFFLLLLVLCYFQFIFISLFFNFKTQQQQKLDRRRLVEMRQCTQKKNRDTQRNSNRQGEAMRPASTTCNANAMQINFMNSRFTRCVRSQLNWIENFTHTKHYKQAVRQLQIITKRRIVNENWTRKSSSQRQSTLLPDNDFSEMQNCCKNKIVRCKRSVI